MLQSPYFGFNLLREVSFYLMNCYPTMTGLDYVNSRYYIWPKIYP